MRKPIDWELRIAVLERDGYQCRYCGKKHGPFELDHVYPESKGGETILENLVVACKKCNREKSAGVGLWPYPIGYFDGYKLSPMDWIMEHFGEIKDGLMYSALVVAFMILPSFSIATTYGFIVLSIVIILLSLGALLSFKKYQRGH